ncbi:phage tail protein [Brevundimonas sp.]|uniref:phage tail protein n=1 Tax=Brevundimonas sp. TaxID=1871086 RepID=UPI002FCC5EE1
MSEFFIGQIMMTGFPYAQKFFAQCNGQTMAISQNQALFSLLGTQFGGNGVSTFMLPNLQGRTPVGAGQSMDGSWNPSPYPVGAVGGVENVTLDQTSIPMHNHAVNATTVAGTVNLPTTPSLYATCTPTGGGTESMYVPLKADTAVPLMATTVSAVGGGATHANMQPFRVINFNMALAGVFPSRN